MACLAILDCDQSSPCRMIDTLKTNLGLGRNLELTNNRWMEPTVYEFAAEARRYCTWAVSIDEGDQGAAETLRRIVALYHSALQLPEASAQRTQDSLPAFVSGEEREAV